MIVYSRFMNNHSVSLCKFIFPGYINLEYTCLSFYIENCLALTMNDYPAWMLVKENGKGKKNLGESEGRDEIFSISGKRRIPVKIPYIRGLSEQVRRLYKNYNIPAYYKPLTHCANSWFHQKTRFPRKEWWAQPVKIVGRTT